MHYSGGGGLWRGRGEGVNRRGERGIKSKCGKRKRIKKIKAVGLVVPLLRHWHPPTSARSFSHSPSRSCLHPANGRKGDHTRHVGTRDPESLRARERKRERQSETAADRRETGDRGRLREKRGRSRGGIFKRRSKRERSKIRCITPVDGERWQRGCSEPS